MFQGRFLDDPGVPSAPATGFADVYRAGRDAVITDGLVFSQARETEAAYDRRIDDVFAATGQRLVHPMRRGVPLADIETGAETAGPIEDPFAAFDRELSTLGAQHPDKLAAIKPDRSPQEDARQRHRDTERAASEAFANYRGAPGMGTAALLAGGIVAQAYDPANLAAMFVGPWGAAGTGLKGLAWMALKQGAANAGVEAAMQPFIARWRLQSGLDYSASTFALNVGAAGVFGAGLDAAVRGSYRGAMGLRGHVPKLDADGNVTAWRSKDQALEEAARESQAADLKAAATGDTAALRRVAEQTGMIERPEIRGALDAAEAVDGLPTKVEGIDDGEHMMRVVAALRHADDPEAHMPPLAPEPIPAERGLRLADDAPAPPAGRIAEIDGRPIAFRPLDLKETVTDAATFQFKRGGDAAGSTGRLTGVERWDPVAAGRAVVYERADGTLVVADAHQRRSLAIRLPDQDTTVEAVVFREVDGWRPEDVRALAAKKNLQEGSGSVVDAATIMRERPDIIDRSVPLGSEAMRQARSLARLSDEAFAAVIGGVLRPSHAAIVADLVADKGRHLGLLEDLARLEPASAAEARLLLNELMAAPFEVQEQLTLLGVMTMERSLLKERVGVLQTALKDLGQDARVFAMLRREAGRIEEAGNRLALDANQQRAAEAATVRTLIEELATRRGPVSDWLNDAARAVAQGQPKARAADAFVRRVTQVLDADGLNGLTRGPEPELSPARALDDPHGPDADAQIARLEAENAAAIDIATGKVDPAEGQASLFALPRAGEADADTGRSMRRDLDQLGYFSAALEAARAWPMTKGTPEQVIAHLKKSGVKDAEIEAVGLKAFTDGKTSLTRDDLVAFLDRNRVGLKETTYADVPDFPGNTASGETKWSSHSLDPSNLTYRETVLHLPGTEAEHEARVQAARQRYMEIEAAARGTQDMGAGYEGSEVQRAAAEMTRLMQERRDFRSGHFPEPNIIGHMMTSMVKHEGRPVYLIDQIQSDWGQKLRDGGVRDAAKIAELRARVDAAMEQMGSEPAKAWRQQVNQFGKDRGINVGASADHTDMVRQLSRIADRRDAVGAEASLMLERDPIRGVAEQFALLRAELRTAEAATPGNPLVNTTDQWTITTLRRALRQAAEADAAYIAIPSGDTVLSYNPGDTDGMRGFYDGIVPKNLRNILRKLDKASPDPIKTDKLETPTAGMKGEGFTVFPLTDAVKAKVRAEGQSLFRRAGGTFTDATSWQHTGLAAAEMPAIRAAVDQVVARLPAAINARVEDRLVFGGQEIDGRFDLHDAAVYVSLSAADPVRVARHEEVHALRALGLFSDQEWRTLTDAVDRLDLKTQYDIDGRYGAAYKKQFGNEADRYLTEEAVAEMIADYAAGRRFGGTLDRILERIRQFVSDVASALGLQGFRTVDDVFRAIETGDVAARDAVRRAMAAEDVTTAAVRPNGSVFMFAGERAKTADLAARDRALEMEAAGRDRDAIWTETGWFRGADGKWRFEIDDSNARLTFDGSEIDGIPLADFINHPELIKQYGRFRDVMVEPELDSRAASGGWWNDLDTITIASDQSDVEMRKTALHEMQHGVQFYEGMAQGGSLRDKTYSRLAGEVEARTVEVRANLTPEQRRSRPPWRDYDVPEADQIVRFADGAPAASLADALADVQRVTDLKDGVEACRL